MASEVGSAYVTLIPSAKGFASRMQKELAGEVAKAGKSIGEDLGEEVGETGGKEAASSFGSTFKSGLGKLSALAGGLAIGATLTKGITDALSAGSLTAKLDAQLGLTGKQAARAGRVAGDLFGQNYGDSMEQVNEAIGFVIRDIDGMRGASDAALGRISTKALNTANIFDQDLGGVTRAVSQLIRNGLAKDADAAFDVLTKGFQSGADKGEDFLDTLNEYGTQFRKLGIDGKTATGLIRQGLQAGARDGDTVADALKEFSIRAVDGSDASQVAYRQLGLSAAKMTDQIAKGGKPAAAGLQTVLDKLRGIKDPVKREAAAVGLFGTKAEDLGQALYKLDPGKAAAGLGKVGGAADEANKAFNDTPAARVQAFIRQLQQGLTDAMDKYVIPAIDRMTPLLEKLGPVFGNISGAIKRVTGFFQEHKTVAAVIAVVIGALVAVTYAHAAALALSSGATKKWLVQTRVAQALTKTWAAVQWLLNAAMSANPIGLVVLAVAALVGIIILAWKRSETFRKIVTGAFDAVKGAASAVVGWFKSMPGKVWSALKSVGSKIKEVFVAGWKLAKAATLAGARVVLSFVKSVPGNFIRGLQVIGGKLKDLFTKAWDLAKTAVVNGVGRVVDAVRDLPGKVAELGGKFLQTGKDLIGKFLDGIGAVGSFVGGFAQDVWNAVKSAINSGIDSLNNLLEFDFRVKGVGFTVNAPDIPHLASGGRATAATVALIGEGREPETVLPDSMLRGLLERAAAGGAAGAGQVAELRITNWEDGTGYFRLVANQAVNSDARFRRNLGAMYA